MKFLVSKIGPIVALLFTAVKADFYFGSVAGQSLGCGTPCQVRYCEYTIMDENTGVCDATSFPPADGSGGCPGQDGGYPNFCGSSVSSAGCPSSFQLDDNDDCGQADTDSDGEGVENGTFYANVIDTDDGDSIVGRCVYEVDFSTTCAIGIGSGNAQTTVHCYMDTDDC